MYNIISITMDDFSAILGGFLAEWCVYFGVRREQAGEGHELIN